MILPTKGVAPDRCILGVGGDLLSLMNGPIGPSTLWARYIRYRRRRGGEVLVTFDWFVLTLDFLFMIGAIGLDDRGRLVKHCAS